MRSFDKSRLLTGTAAIVLAVAGLLPDPAGAAELEPAPPPAGLETTEPAAPSWRLGLTAPESAPGTHRRRRGMGMATDLELGDGFSLRAEGALMSHPDRPLAEAETSTLRGRLAYGGGLESLGLDPGFVTPWVEGAQDWALDAGTVPETSFSFGVDVDAGPSAGFSVSAGTTLTGPSRPDDVSANAGLRLKF